MGLNRMNPSNDNLTESGCIEAGAWYRIWKDVSRMAELQISHELCLRGKENAAIFKACDAVDALETKIGFENKADEFFPNNKDLFYGAIGVPIRGKTDKLVNLAMYDILRYLFQEVQRNIDKG